MNYTKPDDDEHEDGPEDWLSCALVFTGALYNLLKENEGVVVDIKNDMNLTFPDCKQVVVFRKDKMIHIDVMDPKMGLKDGDLVWMHDEDDLTDFSKN